MEANTETGRSTAKGFGRNPPATSALATVAAVVTLLYLTWRLLYTLDANPWLALPLFVAEVLVAVRFLFSLAAIGPAPGGGVSPDPAAGTSAGQDVEVLVVASHGDREALSRTLALASVDGPAGVRVLDDLQRPDLRAEALRHGASYEALEGTGAAELVGLAVRTSTTPYVAWLDAGDVPVPGLLGLTHVFRDPEVAVVQCAADLVNRDSLLHLTPDHDELALGNRVAGPSLDRSGRAPWEGSGSLLRVADMEATGALHGASSSTHRGSLRLARAGRSVRFCPEPLVRTVAPDTLAEYLDIEQRSADSDWKLLGTADTPLRPGAGVRASLTQLYRSTTALDGLARLTMLAVLTAVLLAGTLPFEAPLAVTAAFMVQFALRSATVRSLGRGTVALGDPTRQSLRLMGARISALVTADSASSGDRSRRWAALGQLPLLTAALVVIDVALGLRFATLIWPGLLPALEPTARFLAMAAAVWSVLAVLDVLHVLVSRVQRRGQHRQGTDLVVRLDGLPCRSVDLTPDGVGLLLPEGLLERREHPLAQASMVHLELDIPRVDGSTSGVQAWARIEHIVEVATDGMYRAGAAFVEVTPEGRDALVEFCALTAEHRDRVDRPVVECAPDDYDVATSGAGRRVLAMVSTIGLLAAGPFVAFGPSAGAAEKDPRTAVITGQVLDAKGEPVVGACVGVWNDGGVPWVNTDSSGRYELESVAAGEHAVVVQDCSGSGHIATFSRSTPFAGRADPVSVGAGASLKGVDVTVLAGVKTSGRVLDDRGEPAAQVCVNYGPSEGEPGSDQMWLGYTDSEGRFSGMLPAGEVVRIQMNDCSDKPQFAPTWFPGTTSADKAELVKVPLEGSLELDDAVMQSGAVVVGRVSDAGGKGVPQACVSVQHSDKGSWNWQGGARTDDSGSYRLVVPPGTYSLWFSECNGEETLLGGWYPDTPGWTENPPTVEVKQGENRFDITMREGAAVTGTVFDTAGRPRAEVCVGAVRIDDHRWDWVAGGHTDASGNYRFLAPPGEYTLTASGCDGSSDLVQAFHDGSSPRSDNPPTMPLAAGKNEPVDFRLQIGGHIEGKVVDADGRPAMGVCISATDAEALMERDWHSVGWARSNPDGTWSTRAIPPGEYVVHYSNCDANGDWTEHGTWVPEFHDDVLEPRIRDLQEVEPVQVVAGKSAALSAELLRAARVKGRITSGGSPAEGVCVGTSLGRQVRSDSQGYYSVGLLPGRSLVTFTDCESGRGLVQQVHSIDLAEGEGTYLDAEMVKAQPASITGTVLTASDGVIQPSCVVAYVPDELVGMDVVDPDGSYEIPGLGAGSYWVGVFGCTEDPDLPMTDPDTGEEYPASWFPGVAIDFPSEGPPDPDADGASPVVLEPGTDFEASFCFGGCVKVPESTTTTVPGTTAPPTTRAPTTSPPRTTPPSTARPPTTTPPTAVPPTDATVPQPVNWSPGPPGTGGTVPAPPSAAEVERSTPTTEGPVTASRVPSAEAIVSAPEAQVSSEGVSAQEGAGVEGSEAPVDSERIALDTGEEVASVSPLAAEDGGSHRWLWLGALVVVLAVAGGLLAVRRRLS